MGKPTELVDIKKTYKKWGNQPSWLIFKMGKPTELVDIQKTD